MNAPRPFLELADIPHAEHSEDLVGLFKGHEVDLVRIARSDGRWGLYSPPRFADMTSHEAGRTRGVRSGCE